jgi:hypothetical protein
LNLANRKVHNADEIISFDQKSDLLTNLNRRGWLPIAAAAASGLLLSAATGKPGHDLIRLSLNSRRPQRTIAAALAAQGIDIGRSHPLLNTWVRISIGLPENNAIARQAVADLLQ